MIAYADAAKFLEDSLEKQITITCESLSLVIRNEDIIGESLVITESLCSEPNLYFGTVEPSSIKFTIRNDLPKLYSRWIYVAVTPHGAQSSLSLGYYRVWSEKGSVDRTTREVTAYDGLYKIMTNTYKKWYNSLWEDRETLTMKQFRVAYFERLHQTHSWLTQENVTLPNDDIVLKKSERIGRPSGKDILSAICEINGVFGHLDRNRVFRYINLANSSTVYEIGETYTIGVDFDDYVTSAIDRVEVLAPDGSVFGAAGEEEGDSENKYTVQSNFLIKGLGDDDAAKETAAMIASRIHTNSMGIIFTPLDAEIKGNPCFEVGDRIRVYVRGTAIETYILEREMTGIQSLRDNFAAEGEGVYPDSTNSLSSKIQDAKNSAEEAAKSGGDGGAGGYIVAAYNDATVVYYTLEGQDN